MIGALRRPSIFEQQITQLGRGLVESADAGSDEKIARWRADPVDYFVDRLGVPRWSLVWSELPEYKRHRWDGTPDPLATILRGLTMHRIVGVESGIGTGKTFLLGGIVQWFLSCWKPSTVVSFAPKKDQLKLHLWKELGKAWSRFKRAHPLAELTDLRIRMDGETDAHAAHGFPVGVGADEEVAVKAQGFHDEDMLFLLEETPGILRPVVEALLNTAVDDHNLILAVGNPNHQMDALHYVCSLPGALAVRISALDHPNVVTGRRLIPGAATRASVAEKRTRYGGDEAPLYRSRVRGISPAEAQDAMIKLSWCYDALKRGEALMEKLGVTSANDVLNLNLKIPGVADVLALGVDVANSKDGDYGAIVRGRDNICCDVEAKPCPNSNVLGKRVATEARTRGIDPDYIGVDGVGVGAGTVNELLAQEMRVQNLMGGYAMVEGLEELFKDELFKNLRTQMYWLARLDFQFGRIIILPGDWNEELFQDLITTKWEPKGKEIVAEAKEKIKKDLGRSPNMGDGFVYWNWVRQVRAGASGTAVMVDF